MCGTRAVAARCAGYGERPPHADTNINASPDAAGKPDVYAQADRQRNAGCDTYRHAGHAINAHSKRANWIDSQRCDSRRRRRANEAI